MSVIIPVISPSQEHWQNSAEYGPTDTFNSFPFPASSRMHRKARYIKPTAHLPKISILSPESPNVFVLSKTSATLLSLASCSQLPSCLHGLRSTGRKSVESLKV